MADAYGDALKKAKAKVDDDSDQFSAATTLPANAEGTWSDAWQNVKNEIGLGNKKKATTDDGT